MKTEGEILNMFRDAVKEVDNKDLPDLQAETNLSELGLDSVTTMEVIGTLEEKLNLRFPDEDLATLKSIRDLTTLVHKIAA